MTQDFYVENPSNNGGEKTTGASQQILHYMGGVYTTPGSHRIDVSLDGGLQEVYIDGGDLGLESSTSRTVRLPALSLPATGLRFAPKLAFIFAPLYEFGSNSNKLHLETNSFL